MKWKYWLIIPALLLSTSPVQTYAQAQRVKPQVSRILRNKDVLQMVKSGMQSHLIIANIMTSQCNFDVFPPVLDDLKRRGVPENVLHFMSVVPNGPPHLPDVERPTKESLLRSVKIPKGAVVLVETLYPISSADVKLNNSVAFSVVSAVVVDGVVLIPRGTIARAKIVKVKKAGSFGRGGALTFEMERIIAIDGTRIPVQLTAAAEGGNRSGAVAVGAAATSALIFPYTAPAAIIWGFKKGDDAVVRGNKQFGAVIKADTEVAGIIPGKEKVIYHYAEALKAKQNSTTTPTAFPRFPVRN